MLLDVRSMARIESEPLQWVWPGRIPRKKNSLLVGDPEVGKSILLLDLASRFSTGAKLPDGTEGIGQPGKVLLFCAEDDANDTVKPRLQAGGADMERIWIANDVLSDTGGKRDWFSLDRHFDAIEEFIKASPGPWLIGFDPLQAYLGRADANRDAEVRAVVGRLGPLGAKYDATFVHIMHLNKAVGLPALYRTGGSIAFPGLARAAWLVAKDQDNPERRVMVALKNNLARKVGGLAFRVVETSVTGLLTPVPKLDWEGGAVYADPEVLLGFGQNSPRGPSELERATTWLRERLADGPVEQGIVIQDAEAAGIKERTLERAKKPAGVRSRPRGTSKDRHWFWEITPEDEPPPDRPSRDGGLGGDGSLGGVGDLGALSEEKKKKKKKKERASREEQGRQERQGRQECQGGQGSQDGQGDQERQDSLFPAEAALHDDGAEEGDHG